MKLISFLGLPGSGKGTQSNLISREFNIPIFSPGKLLRIEIENKTRIGKEAEKQVKIGKLVSPQLLSQLLKKFKNEKQLILDGFPRNYDQYEILKQSFKSFDLEVFLLEVDQDTIKNRLSMRKRNDDNSKTIEKRISTFEKETRPLISTFNHLHIIPAYKSAESIYTSIRRYF